MIAIPYLETPMVRLGPVLITGFDLMVVLAVLVGRMVVVRRAERLGWDRERALKLVLWTVLAGGISSHLFAMLVYFPEEVRQNPLVLLQVWGRMSSFGGIVGGILGGISIARRMGLRRREIFAYVDIVAFAFPFAWIFGRLGCSLAHDHIGIEPESAFGRLFAVDFPAGARFDLGLLELFYTLAIAALFLWIDRRRRATPLPTGFYLGLFFTLYGPVRFALDVLRITDVRYFGWTPGQYAALATTLFGAFVLFSISKRPST